MLNFTFLFENTDFLFEVLSPQVSSWIKNIMSYGGSTESKLDAMKRLRSMVTRSDDVNFIDRLIGMGNRHVNETLPQVRYVAQHITPTKMPPGMTPEGALSGLRRQTATMASPHPSAPITDMQNELRSTSSGLQNDLGRLQRARNWEDIWRQRADERMSQYGRSGMKYSSNIHDRIKQIDDFKYHGRNIDPEVEEELAFGTFKPKSYADAKLLARDRIASNLDGQFSKEALSDMNSRFYDDYINNNIK